LISSATIQIKNASNKKQNLYIMKNIRFYLSLGISMLIFTACTYDMGKSGNYIYFDGDITYSEKYKDYGENPYKNTSEEPLSTFSVDADGGSYSNMRRFLNLGQVPPVASVRVEEYINYFTFDYPEPVNNENVSLSSEIATCPWNTAHHLLRIGMKGKTIPLNELPNSNYVFLIDVSGSMSSPDKLEVLKSGFKTMADNLRPQDRVAIVTYAGAAEILLESTPASEKTKIKTAIGKLGAGGSTAGAEGIKSAYKIAKENFITGGNNRVILGTDGDFNVGISTTDSLIAMIEDMRDTGIYLTVLGVGDGNLNDEMMEQIANKGNGNYEYIDNAKQLKKVFTYEISKFYTVAKDAKIQIEFNPAKVESYRLIGYENRKMENEEFSNDSTDAGEIGAGQTITALYEIVVKPENTESLFATFSFRYKKPGEDVSRLLSHQVNSSTKDILLSSENMRFAASVAGFGLLMKQSAYKGTLNQKMVLDLGKNASSFDPNGYRDEFIELVTDWDE
jgi:Ca-activated chloride channel family protein